MSVRRMLDLRPLRPPCPHKPPLRRPRGDEGPARLAACSPSSLAAGGSDSRTGSELAVQLSSELCVSVFPVQGSRLPGDERVGGVEDRNLAFRPLSDGPALVLSTARGGAMTAGVSPSSYPRGPQPPAQRKLSVPPLHSSALGGIPWHPGLWAQGKNARGDGCPRVTPNQSDP